MQQIIVIGAGVSGLSSGIRLLEAGFSVTILTREPPEHTTSAAAGAIWYGWVTDDQRAWAITSLKEFQRLAQLPDSGVREIELRDLYPHPVDDPWFKAELPACAHTPAGELPSGFADGLLTRVPLVEPPVYLLYLRAWFEQLGGRIEQRDIGQLADLYQPGYLIVNCSGVGARQVANDSAVHPIRGQTVVIQSSIQQAYMDDDTFTYIFPRVGTALLGGVSQPGNWSREVDPADTADILNRCQAADPSVQGATITTIRVGLRPGRHAVRLERETVGDDCAVIHNYGHAGVGFTLSWGCAAEVVRLAQQADETGNA